MTDYTELIRSLRNCSNNRCAPFDCGWFDKYQVDESCKEIIMWKAADAIEALQAENADIREELFISQRKYDEFTTIASMQNAMLAKQLPKREEVWKDVIGYEGLYQVSDQARVRNNKGKILKQSVKVGKCVYYKYVKLYKDGQYRQGYVHRMMAECFIPNPDKLPIINHKDEDGTNNRLDNLEWCTVEYNSNYGNAKRNMSRGKRRRAKMEVQDEA